MTDPFAAEVLDLHQYLDAWLKGRIERGNGEPARFAAALADDFRVIHPDGTFGDRNAVLASFAGAWGEKPPAYALEVEPLETRRLAPDLGLVTYIERHRGEPGRARIVCALLRRYYDGRIEWLHLQETPAPHLDAA